MNDRVKELAEKATQLMLGRPDLDIEYVMEKFGKLIVKECMEQVWYTREDYLNENISEVIKERMKQHFGD